MPIVLNEWLIHDLRGDNGHVAQAESAEFLSAFQASTDQIVVLRPSRWTQKAFGLMTISTPPIHMLSRLLHYGILQDALKCSYVEVADLAPLPEELARLVPDDDAYLFQTALAARVPVIVTTDTRLVDRVETVAAGSGIRMLLRAEFIQRYVR